MRICFDDRCRCLPFSSCCKKIRVQSNAIFVTNTFFAYEGWFNEYYYASKKVDWIGPLFSCEQQQKWQRRIELQNKSDYTSFPSRMTFFMTYTKLAFFHFVKVNCCQVLGYKKHNFYSFIEQFLWHFWNKCCGGF